MVLQATHCRNPLQPFYEPYRISKFPDNYYLELGVANSARPYLTCNFNLKVQWTTRLTNLGVSHWHATLKTLKSNGIRARTNLVGTIGTQLLKL